MILYRIQLNPWNEREMLCNFHKQELQNFDPKSKLERFFLYREDGRATTKYSLYYGIKGPIRLIDLIKINNSNIHKNNDAI